MATYYKLQAAATGNTNNEFVDMLVSANALHLLDSGYWTVELADEAEDVVGDKVVVSCIADNSPDRMKVECWVVEMEVVKDDKGDLWVTEKQAMELVSEM